MEQWNSREGVGNRDAIRLLGILSSGLLSILIASLFPSQKNQEIRPLGRDFGVETTTNRAT